MFKEVTCVYAGIYSFPANGNFCRLLITFANRLDPEQEHPSCSLSKLLDTLIVFLKENNEKSQQTMNNNAKLPSMQRVQLVL